MQEPHTLNQNRLISLASGVCPEIKPEEFVNVCAQAGFDAAGIWFDVNSWTSATSDAVSRNLSSTGIKALDIEPIFLDINDDDGDQIIDIAAEIGALHALVVGRDIDFENFTTRFEQLCDRAAEYKIIVVCEFTRIYSIKSLTEALEVIRKVDRPNAGILVDNLHLARCNLEPSDLLDVDPKLLPYVQLSDSSAQPRGDLLFDARNDRCNPGEGELPIQDFLNSIPTYTPLSLEIRSAPLREKFKDPVKRAQEVLKATKRVLNQD